MKSLERILLKDLLPTHSTLITHHAKSVLVAVIVFCPKFLRTENELQFKEKHKLLIASYNCNCHYQNIFSYKLLYYCEKTSYLELLKRHGFISLLKYSTLRPIDVPCTWLKFARGGLAGVMSIWDNGIFIDVEEDDTELDFIQGSESWAILDKAVFSRSENQNKIVNILWFSTFMNESCKG